MNCAEVKYESHNAKQVIERKLNVRHRLQHTHCIQLFKFVQKVYISILANSIILRKRGGKKEGEKSRFIDSYLRLSMIKELISVKNRFDEFPSMCNT